MVRSPRRSTASAKTRSHSRRRLRRSQLQPPIHRQPRRLIPWQPSQGRALIVWGLLMLGVLGLAGRLAYLQLYQGDSLVQMARQQQLIPMAPQPARRPLIDRQGNVVAVDRIVYTLYAHPALFDRDVATIADSLSQLLEESSAELQRELRTQETGIQLAVDIPAELAERVRALRLNGIELTAQEKRVYPQQSLFAPVVGFVNLEGAAQGGVELSQEATLIQGGRTDAAPPGELDALQLTLDGRLQRVVQQELEMTVAEHGAKRGAAIVMDASSGEILSFALAPTFDANRYYDADIDALKNWAVSDLYEPGSTFKPINVAIAIEEGMLAPEDSIYDEGRLQYGEWTIRNSDYDTVGGRGYLTVAQVLAHSSNVGMVHIMEKLRAATYFDWLQRLGLAHKTGIDLPAEASGQLKSRFQFVNSAVEPATAAFGQGFAITPVQLLQLHGALANGGQLIAPHVVRGLVDSASGLYWQPQLPAPRRVFSQQTTAQVLDLMQGVVEDGTGQAAQLPGYPIAGKTGTAQKVTEAGVYGSGRITSFVGILPVERSQYVVLAVIDEPWGDNAYGSTVAAPLVQKILETLVVVEGIPPIQAIPEEAS